MPSSDHTEHQGQENASTPHDIFSGKSERRAIEDAGRFSCFERHTECNAYSSVLRVHLKSRDNYTFIVIIVKNAITVNNTFKVINVKHRGHTVEGLSHPALLPCKISVLDYALL